MRNVLCVQGGNSGTAYWRMFNWWVAAQRTRKAGWHVLGWEKEQNNCHPWQFDIADPANHPFLFGRLFTAGLEADAIVFQRCETKHALSAFYAMKDQFPSKPILSEIDDDIFDVAPYNPAASSLKPGSHLTQIAIDQFRNSDGLIVSTPYLKEVYAEFNEHIYVVPNSIDVQKWDSAKRKKKPGVRVGWVGSGSHSEDLELLDKVIDDVRAAQPEVTFVICSYFQEEMAALPAFLRDRAGVEIVNKWVPILKYPGHVAAQDFDIGLAPLRDNKFNRAKSNLRWLEYSALGIPCVASSVGHFKETLRDGRDALLATTPADFTRGILALVEDSKKRSRIGRAAHARVAEDFNVDKNLDLYLAAVEDCLKRPAIAAPSLLTGVDEKEFEMSPLEVTHEPIPADTNLPTAA